MPGQLQLARAIPSRPGSPVGPEQPPHEPRLKKDCICITTKNLDVNAGLNRKATIHDIHRNIATSSRSNSSEQFRKHLLHTKDQLFLSACPLRVDSQSSPTPTALNSCDHIQQLLWPRFGQSCTRSALRCLHSKSTIHSCFSRPKQRLYLATHAWGFS